ncbi:prepilin-type N-terminal cleavage/methylation domain-containing protein [Clostridium sp. A1-XYC3]|uniref:Prepilin-type N-terminal cleavage/methylation domain-containing protein n=1 Tax=Clostridium tanneri TaxID=3037988 RepID=A0ABU4JX52_9CLOT|nr:prepilin-type N-terminal cleavage/methylation domain-containing protein [Clostridium sp. A1-XYC3]MDW8802736.1 prepilin-type N-terminal cleavage/methylation domain-containing protein [Clostridium sp. A1-XYC3]
MIKNRKKGFTLIEVIIAMLLISITVLIFSNVSYVGIKSSNTSEQKLNSLIIAQNELEKIKANKNTLSDLTDLQDFLKDEDYIYSTGVFHKNLKKIDEKYAGEVSEGINYDLKLTLSEKAEDLIDIKIEVKPQDNNSLKLGTTLYLGK